MRYQRLLMGYIVPWMGYGFYRGWMADYEYSTYTEEIRAPSYELVTERYLSKTVRGCMNACLYGSIGHIFAIYRLMCRTEIYLTNKDPYHHKDAYCELVHFITLPPGVKNK